MFPNKQILMREKGFAANHSKTFFNGALRIALTEILISVIRNFLASLNLFKDVVIQVATSPRLLIVGPVAVFKNAAVMKHMARVTAGTVRKLIDMSVKDLVSTLSCNPPFVSDWSYNLS